jgi:hypothetical protein
MWKLESESERKQTERMKKPKTETETKREEMERGKDKEKKKRRKKEEKKVGEKIRESGGSRGRWVSLPWASILRIQANEVGFSTLYYIVDMLVASLDVLVLVLASLVSCLLRFLRLLFSVCLLIGSRSEKSPLRAANLK